MNTNTDFADDLWALAIGLNAQAAERYKALTPPVAPEDAIPGSEDLDEERTA